jgi:hypothetical protein
VGSSVRSPYHFWFSRCAEKSRPMRSGAPHRPLPGRVAAHRGTYGSPRIAADLREAGWRVSENTVTQLMREQHLLARAKKRRKWSPRP